ncbi:MAG: hypothetical protein ACU85E_08080 [Gammaproteobacteria bacterium]
MLSELFFFFIVTGWFCLPFIPAVIEIYHKADTRPLRVIHEYDVDIHYFAKVFRQFIQQHFLQEINAVIETSSPRQGRLKQGNRYYIINQNHPLPWQESEQKHQVTRSMYISSDSLRLPGAMSYLTELYARDSLYGGQEDIYRALLAENDIELAKASMLLRWMHAGHSIRIAEQCVLHGRVSADAEIKFIGRSYFERLYAPVIHFGCPELPAESQAAHREIKADDLAVAVDVGGGRWLIEEDVTIPYNSLITSNLVVVGDLTIGAQTHIEGSVKSHGKLIIKQGSNITGSVISEHDIDLVSDCKVNGPVVSEQTIYIGSGCSIGAPDKPTTVSAEEIMIKTGSICHGTVWARKKGEIIASNNERH